MRRAAFLLLLSLFAGTVVLEADTIKRKNGRVVQGRVVRFSDGEFTIQVERSGAGPQEMIIAADDVESIQFDAAGGAAAAPAEKLVVLDSQQEVVATGLQVRRGDKVRIRASGEMQFTDGRVTTPAGVASRDSLPFPGEPLGALVAMVGSPQSPTYHVTGTEAEFQSRNEGELYLQINARSLAGARGAYTARVHTPMGATATTSASPASAPAGSRSSPTAGRSLRRELEVPANTDWVDTELDLVAGDSFRVDAEGTIHYTSTRNCGPDGGERSFRDLIRALPVNDSGRGALIAKMGEGGTVKAFFVGKGGTFASERNGRLFLGINDDDYGNNRGSFKVKVEITPKR